MRSNLLILSFLLVSSCMLFAQPVNDDCAGLIDLGIIPYCPDMEFFTNVDATESNIGANNFPTGCSGIGDITFVGRDVWFQFTTDATTLDYTITVTGITDGMGSTPLSNPQITVYRGDCVFDELSLLGCGKAADGENEMAVDIIGLDPNTPYFIRINDWSVSATPNAGTFKLCVKELDPIYIMGEDTESAACMGTLYDSGGEMGDYGNNETFTFTICPNESFACLNIDLQSFNLETNFDNLTFFAGDNTSAPLIANATGASSGAFEIQATSSCVTVLFDSDISATQEGFALTWSCNNAACTGSSIDNPTVINSIPYNDNGVTSCGEAATFGQSPCGNDNFLNGPDYVFQYDSPGDLCVSVTISNAEPGTGVLVLNGPPDDPGTVCVAVSPGGTIASANMETPGTYYIVVANGAGCTDFDIAIAETECAFSTSLVDALCNPINGCQNEDGTPSLFNFEDGFQDIDITAGVNDGCWLGVGAQPDFVWFTIEAQTNGPFGFILESAGNPSDIDFSVWGPFSSEAVCDSAAFVINFISNNQPIRSSWAAGADPTGLADIHPVLGTPVTDDYDCGANPGAGGDDFCQTIPALTGEHYVVLFNDFGNVIDGVTSVDWSPSGVGVLDVDIAAISGADTVLCSGESVQIDMPDWITNIEWLDATNTLSCTDCLDPIATPTETSSYYAIVEALCVDDTVKVDVFVYDVSLGPDITICLGEEVPLTPATVYDDVDYLWTGQNLSCTNCPTTIISTNTPGIYEYTVEQVAATCSLFDTILVEVLTAPAPTFEVSDSVTICTGSSVDLGNPNNDPSFNYLWASLPVGFIGLGPNPSASPTVSTTYYVAVTNGSCPVSSFDSVYVTVDNFAIVEVANDTTVCQGEMVTLGTTVEEPGVIYSWSPDTNLDDPDIPNPIATAETTETYILTATNGACITEDTITVTASVIAIDILNEPDTTAICLGESLTLNVDVQPLNSTINWTTDNGSFTGIGNPLVVSPNIITTYYASVSIPGCIKLDTFTVDVDSLPAQLEIMPSDTAVCVGALVILSTTPPYLPSEFPEIEHDWTPLQGQQSPDSLFNMVLNAPPTPTWYVRETTNGVCTSLDSAFVDIIEISTITITPFDPLICLGDDIDLLATSPDITEFTWTPAENLSCDDCPDPTASPDETTTYMVEGEWEGCPVMQTVTVIIAGIPISGIIDDTNICSNESILLNNLPDPGSFTTYSWTSEPPGFTSTEAQPSVNPTETTTYTLVMDNGACPPVTEQVTISVLEGAAITVSQDTLVCLQSGFATVDLAANGNSTGGTYTWSPDIGSGPNVSVDYNLAGTYEYEVTFTDDCGSSTTDMITVTVAPGINIDSIIPMNNSTFAEGDVIDLTVFTTPASVPNTIYNWTLAGLTIGSESTIPFTLIDSVYNFNISVTTPEGCFDGQPVTINVDQPIWVLPNAFTPDADGKNDRFRLINTGAIEILSFKIWSRWGQLVYDDTNPDGWNGTFKDKPMPSDMYIYNIVLERPSGLIQEQKGDVTLIR